MFERLLIIARDYNTAQHWAKDQKISPGRWAYVSSFYNVRCSSGAEYVKLPRWELRPDASQIDAELDACGCRERQLDSSM